MIETVSDLLKLITRYSATDKIRVGRNVDVTGCLSGEVIHGSDGELILLLSPPPNAGSSGGDAAGEDDGEDLRQADDAIERCDNILKLIEEDLPERAEDFGESVAEKVRDIRAWIEENDHATENQRKALENMEQAVLRWIR